MLDPWDKKRNTKIPHILPNGQVFFFQHFVWLSLIRYEKL
jgi:hypothetical protein